MTTTNVIIDKEKLYRAFKKRGLNASKASEAIGRNKIYFASLVHKGGEMPLPTVVALRDTLGIDREEYEAKEPAKSDSAKSDSVFGADQIVEELKVLNGTASEAFDDISDIRYILNVIAQDLKIIKHELIPQEGGKESE